MKLKNLFTVLFFLVISLLQISAQNAPIKYKIKGEVVDSLNNPVANAVLTIDGKVLESVTDQYGDFKIKVPSSSKNIGVSLMSGFLYEEPINGRSKIKIVIPTCILGTSNQSLLENDDVVNIGYGTTTKKHSATSTTRIDSKGVDKQIYSNIYDMIRGKIPGVIVNGTSIIIRGTNTINLSSEALLVVDGQIVKELSFISPTEVKSIDVLKGSDATIYGSRGANGVVLITLKKGIK